MSSQIQNRYYPTEVSPPGATLRDLLEERGISQSDLAARMGRPQKTINEIVNGKAGITPETALELELVLGISAHFWQSREARYREYLARREQQAALSAAHEWARRFPISAMARAGWIEKGSGPVLVRELLEFFGIASPAQWEEFAFEGAAAFRRSMRVDSDVYATSAWLRRGVQQAELQETEPFNAERFLEVLEDAKALTTEPPEVFQAALAELGRSAGVVICLVPQLPKCPANGATRWISPRKALIQLSIRHRYGDILWFTFFHEAAHILLHGKRLVFIESANDKDELEEEANAFARDFLIPPEKYSSFVASGSFSKGSISLFARDMGIAPGIVVGRLHHDSYLPHSYYNDLRVKYKWSFED